MRTAPLPALAALAPLLLLGGCISFGAEPPPTLLALTPAAAPAPGASRSGDPARALVVAEPQVPAALATVRVPVKIDASNIAYVKDAQWVDKPARLMRTLISETIAARSNRLVLDAALGEGGDYLTGVLTEFGYDAATGEVVVTYDAIRGGGQTVTKQRFSVREPVAAAEAGPVGAALNRAANRVAVEVADWVG